MEQLWQRLDASPSLRKSLLPLQEGAGVAWESLGSGGKVGALAMAWRMLQRPILWIVREGEESTLYTDLQGMGLPRVLELPAWEDPTAPSVDLMGQRMAALFQLLEPGPPPVLLTSLQGALQRTVPPQRLRSLSRRLLPGLAIGQDELLHLLEEGGYKRTGVVSDKGQYAVRGGILDLFPVDAADPVRIELWGDAIADLRRFDVMSQRSLGALESLLCLPAQEHALVEAPAQTASLLESFSEPPLVVWDGLVELEERACQLGVLGGSTPPWLTPLAELRKRAHGQVFCAEQPLEELGAVRADEGDRILLDWAGTEVAIHRPKLPVARPVEYLETDRTDLPPPYSC